MTCDCLNHILFDQLLVQVSSSMGHPVSGRCKTWPGIDEGQSLGGWCDGSRMVHVFFGGITVIMDDTNVNDQ
jgi:hypothetical protein